MIIRNGTPHTKYYFSHSDNVNNNIENNMRVYAELYTLFFLLFGFCYYFFIQMPKSTHINEKEKNISFDYKIYENPSSMYGLVRTKRYQHRIFGIMCNMQYRTHQKETGLLES